MKGLVSLFILCLIVFVPTAADALSVSAEYACVIDAGSGRILYEKNAHKTHSMASTTKIMTAYVALLNTSPDEIVTVSEKSAGVEGSSMYLKSGEKLPMHDLLYGLMLSSGNDAAVAIAEHAAKSVDGFCKLMNDAAKKIGANNTIFKNPNGLDAEGHYTTAYDLAKITRAALKNPDFLKIVQTKSCKLTGSDTVPERYLTNHNKLLRMYPGCIGVKTGYTKKTGRCLVSAAEKDNMRVICVTLSAPDDWNDHKNMLDYAFSNYSAVPLIKKDVPIKTVPVSFGDKEQAEIVPKENYYVLSGKNENLSDYKIEINLPENLRAPIAKEDCLGSLTISYSGEILKQIELTLQDDILYIKPPKPSFREILYKLITPFGG